MKNTENGIMQFHPVVLMAIGLAIGLAIILLGWQSWLDDVLDVCEAFQDIPKVLLVDLGRVVACSLSLRK